MEQRNYGYRREFIMSQWTAVQTFTLAGGPETLKVQIPQPLLSEYFRLRWNP